jgi:hypothetical protein
MIAEEIGHRVQSGEDSGIAL